MNKIVFLVEESSLKEFLDSYLPRFLPDLDFLCVKHEGKQDLEKSIPRKLRAWQQQAQFVVVRDNDGADCKVLKARLLAWLSRLIPEYRKIQGDARCNASARSLSRSHGWLAITNHDRVGKGWSC
jgi:hypothetical protein